MKRLFDTHFVDSCSFCLHGLDLFTMQKCLKKTDAEHIEKAVKISGDEFDKLVIVFFCFCSHALLPQPV